MTSAASISVVLVRPLVVALTPIPGALDAFWRATDLTPEMIADADARVSPAQFCIAWSEAVRLTGDAGLALAIAEATPQGAFGIVEYVCRSAATIGASLTQWVRFLGILDDAVEVGLVTAGDETVLRVVTESEAPAPASHELCWALVVRHAREVTGSRLDGMEVRFAHPAPAGQSARYRTWFGANVRWDAPHTELAFPTSSMSIALRTCDPNLLAILLPTADEQRSRPSTEPSLTAQVRRALHAALSQDEAQLEVIAKRLGLTGRSLQRRLSDEGSSFQSLRDETRRALADRYLKEGLSVAEISFLLGFSEPSAFFRAFKRWTGLTPIEQRSRARA